MIVKLVRDPKYRVLKRHFVASYDVIHGPVDVNVGQRKMSVISQC